MAEIRLKNQNRIDGQIRKAILAKMRRVFQSGEFLLNEQASVLRDAFAGSEEFRSLGGRLKGEFGFTDEEVANLDKILTLMTPARGSPITISKVKTTGNKLSMLLEWVDFEQLKTHEFAQHALTRLDSSGQVVGVTDIISWVEWLEEGAAIRGYSFFRPRGPAARFSRSGEGLMRKNRSNFWTFEPTRILETIAKRTDVKTLRKGFGILVKRFGRQ